MNLMRAGRIETNTPAPGVAVVALSGEHDLSTAEELRDAFRAAFGSGQSVVVDMSGVVFIDSSIVAALVECGQSHDGQSPGLAIHLPADASASVRRVIDLTGLVSHIPFAATMDEAIGVVSGVS